MQCHDYLALEPAKLFKCPNIQLTRTDHRKLLHKLRSTQSGSGCSVTEVIVPAKVPPPKLERQSSLKTKLLQYKPNWSVSYTQDIKCDDVVLKVAMTAFVCGACSSVLCVCLFYVSHARVLLGSVCSLCYLCESCTSKGNILSPMCSLLVSTCAISSRHFLCVYLLLLHFLDIRVPLGMLTVAQKLIAKKSLNLCSFFLFILSHSQQISQLAQKRTLNVNLRPVATGNWGCGANKRGDVQLKMVIQWMAASVAGLPYLSYYTAGNEKLSKVCSISMCLTVR